MDFGWQKVILGGIVMDGHMIKRKYDFMNRNEIHVGPKTWNMCTT